MDAVKLLVVFILIIIALRKRIPVGVALFGAGLLTGKYGKNLRPEGGRLTTNPQYVARYAEEGYYEVAEAFTNFARERGYDPAALAVAWVGANPAITAPIIGARNLEQLEGSLKSVEIEMTEELYKEVSALSPEPPMATDRSEDKQ